MSDKPHSRVTHGTSTREPISMHEGHAAKENELIAKLFGKDRPALSPEEEQTALHQLEVIQRELNERNDALDKIGGPMWQGMQGR